MDPAEIKLGWDDLLVDHVTPAEAQAWLGDWQWLGLGQIAPIFLSRFGNWFFQRPDGNVYMLDVCSAQVETIAPNFQQFQPLVNNQEWQENFLYSALVLKYRRQGIVAQGRDAIGLVPPPMLTKSIDDCKPMVMSMNVWQSICGQTMRQTKGA